MIFEMRKVKLISLLSTELKSRRKILEKICIKISSTTGFSVAPRSLADSVHTDGNVDVYFKSQNPYTYTEAKEYCNRQGGLKATEVGTHRSQLWRFNQTTGTLINKGIWKSPKNVIWKMVEKNATIFVLSGKKIPKIKDINVTIDANKKATRAGTS